MTDYTNDERNMSRDEIALRLNVERSLKKCYESECTALKKELEDTKASFEMLLKGANANASALSLENEKLKKQIAELNGENDRLKKEVKETRVVFEPTSYLKDIWTKNEEIRTLRKKNLDLKHELDICTKEIKHLREITTDDHISNLATKLNYECATKENEKLRKKVANQKTQLVDIQQALLNRNMTIEALTGENDRLKKEVVVFDPSSYLRDIQAKDDEIETLRKKNLDLKNENDRLKKEVKETRVVFEPTTYLIDIRTRDEEIKNLRKKNLDLKNENEGLKVKLDSHTQPLYIENLNVTYYANGPIWTDEEDKDDVSGSDE